jgi:hypothetical protein
VASIDDRPASRWSSTRAGRTGEDFDPNYSPFKVPDWPIPYNIDFTVTVYSRFQTELMPITGPTGPGRPDSPTVRLPGNTRGRNHSDPGSHGGPEIVTSETLEIDDVFPSDLFCKGCLELNLFDVQQITTRINTVARPPTFPAYLPEANYKARKR